MSIKPPCVLERPRVGVGVVVVKNGKVLLGQRRGSHGAGNWACPGGHLEFGETIEECVKRELLEEANLEVVSLKHGPWTNDLIDLNKHYVTLFVFVEEFKGEPELMEPEKCLGWEWFEWDSLPEPLFPPLKSLIELQIKNNRE